MAVQVLRFGGQVIVYTGDRAKLNAQEDNQSIYQGQGTITTGYEIEYTSCGVRKVEKDTGYADVRDAIAWAAELPLEAEAVVYGWCLDHGRVDFTDGVCFECMEDATMEEYENDHFVSEKRGDYDLS